MTDATPATRARLPLHWKMAIGFGVGLIVGLIVHATGQGDAGWVQDVTKYVTTPFSKIFLNLIFMLIVPLLFSALVCGIAEMGDIRALGRIGWKTLAYTVLLSAVAVLLGLLLVNLLKPGVGVDPALAQQLIVENAERTKEIVASVGSQPTGMDMLLSIVPDNVIGAASSNAAILSLNHSFTVDNYYCGAPLGTLTVNGTIGQKFRGPVGRGGGSGKVNGYTKDYNYDDRLRFRAPPHFLDPVQAAWRIQRYTEQVPAR